MTEPTSAIINWSRAMLALIVGLGTEPVFPAFEGLKLKKKKIEI
jgi:hypothetical protein